MNDVIVRPDSTTVTPVGLPGGGPTFAGFKWFVQHMMGVPAASVPDDSYLQVAYDQAVALTYWGLATIPTPNSGFPWIENPIMPPPLPPGTPSIYAIAVYNLGCAFLLEFAQDDPDAVPPNTFWADLRQSLGLNSFNFGLITSAADQGTSENTYIPEQIKGMTLMDLQLAKSPWGRKYLMIAGQWGNIWGITF
jgi:hypothetical protein